MIHVLLFLYLKSVPLTQCFGYVCCRLFHITWQTKNVQQVRALKRSQMIRNYTIKHFTDNKISFMALGLESFVWNIVLFDEGSIVYGLICCLGLFLYPDMKLKEKDNGYQREMYEQFSSFIMSTKLLIQAGMPSTKAVERSCPEGTLGRVIKVSIRMIKQGESVSQTYLKLSNQIQMDIMTRFCRIMIQDERHGSKETLILLDQLLDDVRKQRKTQLLKKAEEASTKLLLPMMMALLGVLIAVTVPAVAQLFSAF